MKTNFYYLNQLNYTEHTYDADDDIKWAFIRISANQVVDDGIADIYEACLNVDIYVYVAYAYGLSI